MSPHVESLRFALAEWLLYKAWRVLPNGREKREMAIFLQRSWIGRSVDAAHEHDASLTDLQREWKRKLNT